MTTEEKPFPVHISRSNISTEKNRTGTWRFVRPGYHEKTAPCSRACPAGEDIARIEMLAGRGMYPAAWETIMRENPFPAICGRVCFHPCEGVCNRAEMDTPVAIHHLERFIGDTALREGYPVPHPFYGDEAELARRSAINKRIAIAGAGPAGLSAAYFLTRLGFACEVFEADTEPGGVLRWGIPWYRLPEDVLKIEISRIIDMGVRIHCKQPVTREFLKEARKEFDAVFMGCGHGRSVSLRIPGEEYAADGLLFLHTARDSRPPRAQGTAAVIGGGNTAIDVSRTLVRLGAEPMILYRRRREDMPAFDHEIEMALEEGIALKELAAPVRIEAADGGYDITVQRMKFAGMETETGRGRMVPDGDRTEVIHVDQVFSAIGGEPGENWYTPPQESDRVLHLNHCAFTEADLPTVYGGDLTNPVKSAADAIASGKEAAVVLDTFFREGRGAILERVNACRIGSGPSLSMEIYLGGERRKRDVHIVGYDEINTDYFFPAERSAPSVLPMTKRVEGFSEVEGDLPPDAATAEAQRCFNCGICNECDNCRLYCPEVAIYMDGTRCINLDYCKGCGICVEECPRSAMSLEEEKI